MKTTYLISYILDYIDHNGLAWPSLIEQESEIPKSFIILLSNLILFSKPELDNIVNGMHVSFETYSRPKTKIIIYSSYSKQDSSKSKKKLIE